MRARPSAWMQTQPSAPCQDPSASRMGARCQVSCGHTTLSPILQKGFKVCCPAKPPGLPLKNGDETPVQPAFPLFSKAPLQPSQGSQRPIKIGVSPHKGWESLVQGHNQTRYQARQQPRSAFLPTIHLSGLPSLSLGPHMRHGVGGPVITPMLGVPLLVIQPKRPSTWLTQRQGHLAAGACHMRRAGAEPRPALMVSGSAP